MREKKAARGAEEKALFSNRTAARLRGGVLAVLLLCASGLAAARYLPPAQVQTASAPVSPPEPDRRAVRESAYDKDVAALEALIRSPQTDEATRAQAAAVLTRLVEEHQTELAVEAALEAAGYQPKLVLMQNSALTIMLDGKASAEASALILELCAAHGDVAAQNVRIMGE